MYLEPWHSDIFEWLDLRKNHGKEEVSISFDSYVTGLAVKHNKCKLQLLCICSIV